MMRTILLAASAMLAIGIAAASAQPRWVPPGNPPDGYYSETDHDGFYDRDGRYRHIRNRDDRGYNNGPRAYDNGPPPPPDRAGFDGPPPPPPPGNYYQQGRYEQDCHRGNTAAGTIFGALAGGAIGAGVSHGNGGAVVGGAILGGLLGNTISRDIDCDDQPYAFRTYSDGLNGDLNRRYDWRRGENYGYFTPMREYRRGGVVCRDFTETTYRGGRSTTRTGTACRETGGNWRFD